MKLKNLISLGLSFVMAVSSQGLCFAQNSEENNVLQEEEIVSGAAIEIEEKAEHDNEIDLAATYDTTYAVEGGNIYFDSSTGTIIDCDTAVTSAVIPETINEVSVTSIGYEAFEHCNSLTSITIPDSVTSIDDYAFWNCNSLTSINVESNNKNYTSIKGILFNKNKTTIIHYPQGLESKNYEIPNSVTSIWGEAFRGCSSLTSITIPDSVTSIGSYAFGGCSSLTSITIPDSVTSIGSYAFRDCSSLTSITIPDSVTSIGTSCFKYCSSLTSITIPDSVTSIGWDAFSGCKKLTIHCFKGSYAESYAKDNNIPYLSDGYIEYTLTESDLPADIGDSIKFKKKIYEFSKDSFIDTGSGYNGQLYALLKDENMADKITYSYNENIVELSPSKNSQIYIHLIGEENYNCEKTINAALLKNGETIVTASLPNGDRSSCIVRVKGFPMAYEYKSDPETPHIKVNTSFDNQFNYQNGSFDKSTIPVKISVSNIAIIKESGEGYTEEELSKCNLKDVKMQIELPEGLSLSPDNSSDKFKTFDMNDIDVGGSDSIEFNIYPTSLAAKTLKFYAKLTSNNYKESNTYIINVNADEKVNYDVANPFFTGFLDEDGKLTALSPEERIKINIEKYNATVADYENFTINRLNKMKDSGVSQDDKIFENIKQKVGENMEFAFSSQSGNKQESERQEKAALMGLYKYISEQTDGKIAIGDIDINKTDDKGMVTIEAKIVKEVLKNIKTGKHTYNIDDYSVTICYTGFIATTGSITLVDRTTGKDVACIGTFSTNTNKCMEIMSSYASEIQKLGLKAVDSSIYQMVDFFGQKMGTDKYIKDSFKKFIEEKLPILKNKGLGEVASFIYNAQKIYGALKKLDVNNLESSKKALDIVSNLEKELETPPTITNSLAKTAYSKVEKAEKAIISSVRAYLTNSPEPDNIITKNKNVVKSWVFMCPVNVIVCDENGNQIGSIIDDDINTTSEIIGIRKDGDLKIVYLYEDNDISFDITATDYGTLNVTVEDYNSENVALGRSVLYDIPLHKDESLTANTESGNVIVKTENHSYSPDEVLLASESCGVKISANSENGQVYGCGEYVKGDFVKLTAIPNEDYLFEGWYNGERFLSNNINYDFTAKENLNLTAKFIALSEIEAIYAPEITASEIEPENGKEINISIKTGVEDAKIYYTTDGTEPTVNSKEYTEPFTISGTDETIIVKAITAVDDKVSEATVIEIKFSKYDLSNIKFGDIDSKRGITANDAALVLQKVLNSSFPLPIQEKTNEWLKYADVSGDKKLTAADAAIILQKALDSNFTMPVEVEK